MEPAADSPAARRAAIAARLRRGREPLASSIPLHPPGTAAPLSFEQERLWSLEQSASLGAAYNISFAVALHGPLDIDAFRAALEALVARHGALRTRLGTASDGRPVQLVDPPAALDLPVDAVSDDQLPEFAARVVTGTFTLAGGPLVRLRLARVSEQVHFFFFVAHHSVFDGVSAALFVSELSARYEAAVTGTIPKVPALAVQFRDYAGWERQRAQSGAFDELAAFWRDQLRDLDPLRLPTDRPRPDVMDYKGGVVLRTLDPRLLAGFIAVARQQGSTLATTMLAAFIAWLHRYSGQSDFVVGIPAATRGRPELVSMIGYLVNTLPIRADVSGDPTFSELLRRVGATTSAAYAHQDLPFALIVDACGPGSPSGRPLSVPVLFSFLEVRGASIRAGGVEFGIADFDVDPGTARHDLQFTVGASPDELHVGVGYATAVFDRSSVEPMLDRFEALLQGLVADPGSRVAELPW